ncbi:MAG: DDE-type integrase/transposase/recombinase [Nitrososphaerales archaeon]|nr:DDE-type integrase/transposase/recombinase [Nitrososphaerales archaeon]
MNIPDSSRMSRGLEIAKMNVISENADGSFSVPSQADRSVEYQVKALGQVWVCSCPDFENRADTTEACKHVHAARFWVAAQVELAQKPRPKVFAEDALQCPKCGSIRAMRFGTSRGKQAFKCNDCSHRFREQSLLKGSRYSPEMVSLTLDLYFSNMSERRIARTLNDHFGTRMGGATVHRWVEKFVPAISEYVNTLAPQLSETWHADELFVKMKGGETIKDRKNMAYLWNVMDRGTRFLLASKLSKHRDVGGAARAFMEAKKNAHERQPEKVFTDGLKAYREGLSFAFVQEKPEHIANSGIKKPHATNNRIERMNGTLRERVKVQRGWKRMDTKLAEGQRIQYNFVRPHAALEGQTPAERAGIGVEGKDKWLSLLKAALTTPNEASN